MSSINNNYSSSIPSSTNTTASSQTQSADPTLFDRAKLSKVKSMLPILAFLNPGEIKNVTLLSKAHKEQVDSVTYADVLKYPMESSGKATWKQLQEYKALTGKFPSPEKIVSLDLSNSAIDNAQLLEVCQHFPNLQSLNLAGCYELTDVSFLARYSNLQTLDLGWCRQLTDISFLASCENLQSLNLENTQITDISPLANCTQLRILLLGWCEQLIDISSLANSTSLTLLSLPNCKKLSDISPLASCTNLQTLDLRWCRQLTDISPLARCKNLQKLQLPNVRMITSNKEILEYVF